METTWILIADRAQARVFENNGPGTGLRLVREVPHPAGRLKNQDINADKPGRSFDSHGQGRHAMSKEHEPTEHVAQMFAKELSTLLEEARTHNRYHKLVLVAEPGFLGELRASLNTPTSALVSDSVRKDLSHIPERELPSHLGDAVHL
jgi:protein required for attachment to host cells